MAVLKYDMIWESRLNRFPESCDIRAENKDPDDYSASTMSNSNLTFHGKNDTNMAKKKLKENMPSASVNI